MARFSFRGNATEPPPRLVIADPADDAPAASPAVPPPGKGKGKAKKVTRAPAAASTDAPAADVAASGQ